MGEARERRIAQAATRATAKEPLTCRYYGGTANPALNTCGSAARLLPYGNVMCDRHWQMAESMCPEDEWEAP